MFMDYWFAPIISSAFDVNIPCWIDLLNNFAAIPGNGNAPMVLTHSRDVGRFVAAALDLPKWKRSVYLIGDRLTLNEFLGLAEEAKGVNFEKHHDSIERLTHGECTLTPACETSLPEGLDRSFIKAAVAGAGSRGVRGEMDLPTEDTLNKAFPELVILTVRDAVNLWVSQQV